MQLAAGYRGAIRGRQEGLDSRSGGGKVEANISKGYGELSKEGKLDNNWYQLVVGVSEQEESRLAERVGNLASKRKACSRPT